MKKLFFLLIFGFMINAFLGFAQYGVYAQNESTTAINIGNKICPVTGEKIDGKTTYEYQGKIYNFCCPACIDEFKKDTEKYIKKVEEELKGEPKKTMEEQKSMPESGSSMGEHSGHQH